jgi:apolipoprotein N-acyltransferase
MILATTLFNPTKISLFVIIVVLLFFKKFKKPYIFLALIPLLYEPKTSLPPLKINLITTHIPQELKWQQSHIPKEIESNFKYIENSINKFDVVVLPESAFPIFLNLYPELIQELNTLSKKITIITGALHLKDNKFFNSTYIFENGKMKIIDKHLLVPFGEYIPFPIFQEEINKIFFKGASDYATSPSFNTFKIKDINFINAICYEATSKDLYKLTPKYVIALSNLAWFNKLAYIEQKMLIRHYAKEHKKAVFHSINAYKSYVIN